MIVLEYGPKEKIEHNSKWRTRSDSRREYATATTSGSKTAKPSNWPAASYKTGKSTFSFARAGAYDHSIRKMASMALKVRLDDSVSFRVQRKVNGVYLAEQRLLML